MSGSWDQLGRDVVNELKETLRLHFSNIQVDSVPMTLSADTVALAPAIEAEAYGGQLFLDHLVSIQSLNCAIAAWSHAERAWVTGCVETVDLTFQSPDLLQWVPVLTLDSEQILSPALIRRETTTHPYEIDPFRVHMAVYGEPELDFSRMIRGKGVGISVFAAPKVRRIGFLSAASRKYPLHVKAFPFRRSPIAPHRFSTARRKAFRELLAQRAQQPYADIQVVRVYDRIYLELFKTLTQDPQGLLLCYPKSETELNQLRKSPRPYYVIIGKNIKDKSAKWIQTAVPMDEEEAPPV